MNIHHLDYLRHVLDQEVERDEVKGAAASVVYKGREVYRYSAGCADTKKGTPMKEDTIIRLFSMSKPVTSAAAMILYERGMLDLFTPVSEYLEDFEDQKVYTIDGLVDADRPILVRDLLNMTSPIPYPDASEGNWTGNRVHEYFEQIKAEMREGKETSTRDFVVGLSHIPMAFQPGDHWMYSVSADILGAVIEAIAGQSFGSFLKQEIFDPLGMVDTGFYVPPEKTDRFAEASRYDQQQGKLVHYEDLHLCVGDWLSAPAFESGGAGLVSTMCDMTKFALMLLGGGSYEGRRILGPRTVRFMRTGQLTKEQSVTANWESCWGYGYGNLMRTMEDPAQAGSNCSVGEFGWDGWMGNYFFMDPADDLVFFHFIQAADSPVIQRNRRKMRQIVYGALE